MTVPGWRRGHQCDVEDASNVFFPNLISSQTHVFVLGRVIKVYICNLYTSNGALNVNPDMVAHTCNPSTGA